MQDDDRWLLWTGIIIVFVIFHVVRAVLRGAKQPGGGMARLEAAAERILKERGAAAANPIPRNQAAAKPAAAKPTAAKPVRQQPATAKPRQAAVSLPKSSTPAVLRRHGLLAGDREPVVQRRR